MHQPTHLRQTGPIGPLIEVLGHRQLSPLGAVTVPIMLHSRAHQTHRAGKQQGDCLIQRRLIQFDPE